MEGELYGTVPQWGPCPSQAPSLNLSQIPTPSSLSVEREGLATLSGSHVTSEQGTFEDIEE